MLSRDSAAEIGRSFKLLRHANELTLREAAKNAGISPQYLQNIEAGVRTAVSEEVWLRVAGVYKLNDELVRNLLLRGEVQTALEHRGLTPEERTAGWNGLVAGLAGAGVRIETDLARELAKLV